MVAPAGFRALPLSLAQLSLDAVLKCGQSFRWSAISIDPSTEYRLCLRDRVVCLRQSPTELYYTAIFPDPQPIPTQLSLREAETLAWLNNYFQLDVDLVSLYKEWAASDAVFASFKDRFVGIRMLRQDPWENLISFICSSNNNISRITKMVQNLCRHFSPSLLSAPDPNGHTTNYHPFPSPSVLAAHEVTAVLRGLGFGYRADFIQKTAKMLVDAHGVSIHPTKATELSETWLEGLRLASTEEARASLLTLMGVGRKVADCVLLMSLDKKEVIPVDTHVHQIAIKHYGMKRYDKGKVAMTPKLYDEVNNKLASIWGDYAGWAHSILFTADLKAFASYGLLDHDTPPNSLATKKRKSNLMLPTPPPTPLKRRKSVEEVSLEESDTLAERVKRRRR